MCVVDAHFREIKIGKLLQCADPLGEAAVLQPLARWPIADALEEPHRTAGQDTQEASALQK